MREEDKKISETCKHKTFNVKGNVPYQSVDSVEDYLRLASASLASVNLAGQS